MEQMELEELQEVRLKRPEEIQNWREYEEEYNRMLKELKELDMDCRSEIYRLWEELETECIRRYIVIKKLVSAYHDKVGSLIIRWMWKKDQEECRERANKIKELAKKYQNAMRMLESQLNDWAEQVEKHLTEKYKKLYPEFFKGL